MVVCDLVSEWTKEAAESSRRRALLLDQFASGAVSSVHGPARLDPEFEAVFIDAHDTALSLARAALRMWHSVSGKLEKGISRDAARGSLNEVVTLFDSAARLVESVRASRRFLPAAVESGNLKALESALASTTAPRAEASRLLAALDRPRPQVDEARLADGVRAAAEGRVVDAADAIARVRSLRGEG